MSTEVRLRWTAIAAKTAVDCKAPVRLRFR
jgi:hypothetical protein